MQVSLGKITWVLQTRRVVTKVTSDRSAVSAAGVAFTWKGIFATSSVGIRCGPSEAKAATICVPESQR